MIIVPRRLEPFQTQIATMQASKILERNAIVSGRIEILNCFESGARRRVVFFQR